VGERWSERLGKPQKRKKALIKEEAKERYKGFGGEKVPRHYGT